MDQFTYEICSDAGCDQANVNVIIKAAGQLTQMDMILYPVPAENELNVLFGSDADATAYISIYDALGRIIIDESAEVSQGIHFKQYDVSYLPKGVYFIQINIGDFTQVKKLLID